MKVDWTVSKVLWLICFLLVLAWSGVNPYDQLTWALEVAPAIVGLFLIAFTYNRFPLTNLLYTLILIHSVVLMVGGHYTYANVPLGEWMKDWFEFERNNYDKIGHFMQGFVPAILAREILIRNRVVTGNAWLFFIVVSICLGFSAFYELIEWWVALLSDEAAESFLGTQGFIWDTQSDMAWALFAAIMALLTLGRFHDQQITKTTANQ